MVECIQELLKGGYGVLLDGLAKFSVSISSPGADTAEDFSISSARLNVNAQIDDEMITFLNNKPEFEYVASRKLQAEAKKQEKAALNGGDSGSDSGNNSGSDQGGSGTGDSGDVTP